MRPIEPEMVLGKLVVDHAGSPLGEIVDVGVYAHDRVKFLVVQDAQKSAPTRRVLVEAIAEVSPSTVRLTIA